MSGPQLEQATQPGQPEQGTHRETRKERRRKKKEEKQPPAPDWWNPLTWPYEWRERAATIVIMLALAVAGLLTWLKGPTLAVVTAARDNPTQAVPGQACTVRPKAGPVKVSDASGTNATLNIFIGRGGAPVERQTSPLAINGTLPPGTILCTAISDLMRGDGQTLPANQAASWAQVDNTGTHAEVFVKVAPRFDFVSGFGGYSGTVSLDDARAIGANVPVNVHVQYYDAIRPVAWAVVAAFGGFIWAWFIHRRLMKGSDPQPFWGSLTLRVAVLLVAVPVVNAQVLSNPDWDGSLSRYITLASLAGGAAIAATPTLYAVTSRIGALRQHHD
jgi:hypothetical protein